MGCVLADEIAGKLTNPAKLWPAVLSHAKEGTWPVTVTLTYQACDDRKCLPPVTTFQALEITVGAAGAPQAGEVFGITMGSLPDPKTKSLPLMLLLGILGGLILNAMPCVLPVLSLKVFGLVKSAGLGRSQVVVGSLATAAGIFISFWALALAAILARSAGSAVGWGIQFQEPVFVTFLVLVVVLFCLNLWGLFEIPLPARLAQVADSGPQEGVPGHLASGLFATLMATPCSAPFLGTAVGFGLGQEAPVILAIFTAIALGMALPYLLLAAAPGTAKWLPKPGPWMDKLRVVMGFLLAGAAVWLFYVLSAQMSTERLAFIELTLLVMTLLIWVRHQGTQHPTLRVTAALGIVLLMSWTLALAAGAQDGRGQRTFGSMNQLITWATFDRQKAEELAREGHLVFVDVTADWCFTCKVNEHLVLETPEVAAVFERHGVMPMKADWTTHSDSIARFLADFGRYGIPFYLLYRPFDEPYLFAELLTKEGLIRTVEEAASKTAATQDQDQLR